MSSFSDIESPVNTLAIEELKTNTKRTGVCTGFAFVFGFIFCLIPIGYGIYLLGPPLCDCGYCQNDAGPRGPAADALDAFSGLAGASMSAPSMVSMPSWHPIRPA